MFNCGFQDPQSQFLGSAGQIPINCNIIYMFIISTRWPSQNGIPNFGLQAETVLKFGQKGSDAGLLRAEPRLVSNLLKTSCNFNKDLAKIFCDETFGTNVSNDFSFLCTGHLVQELSIFKVGKILNFQTLKLNNSWTMHNSYSLLILTVSWHSCCDLLRKKNNVLIILRSYNKITERQQWKNLGWAHGHVCQPGLFSRLFK